jgi:hypothetical protein
VTSEWIRHEELNLQRQQGKKEKRCTRTTLDGGCAEGHDGASLAQGKQKRWEVKHRNATHGTSGKNGIRSKKGQRKKHRPNEGSSGSTRKTSPFIEQIWHPEWILQQGVNEAVAKK